MGNGQLGVLEPIGGALGGGDFGDIQRGWSSE